MSTLSIRESDSAGRTLATYLMTDDSSTPVSGSGSGSASSTALAEVGRGRGMVLERKVEGDAGKERKDEAEAGGGGWRVDVVVRPKVTGTALSRLWQSTLAVFLPVGYPASVTEDYLKYQIYDSLQAFSSSIAGLLSNRAVLEGVGVGDSTATPTAALLLSVLQDSTGRLATIFFAHRLGTALEPECKMYRLSADVMNDCAMLLDCLSPALPKAVRVGILSLSGVLRALCGVAAGGAKASLSVHFARNSNVGELNAKDASQETVISLLGMLVGSLVVSLITSPTATWSCLILLLAIHLGMNHAAVRAVRMNTLNRQRANILFSHMLHFHPSTPTVLTPADVSSKERIFEHDGVLRWKGGPVIGTATIGVSLQTLLRSLGDGRPSTASSLSASNIGLNELLDLFRNEDYILWPSKPQPSTHININININIVLKQTSSPIPQLKAWAHALLLAHHIKLRAEPGNPSPPSMKDMLKLAAESLSQLTERWKGDVGAMKASGWDLEVGSLETWEGCRVAVEGD